MIALRKSETPGCLIAARSSPDPTPALSGVALQNARSPTYESLRLIRPDRFSGYSLGAYFCDLSVCGCEARHRSFGACAASPFMSREAVVKLA
jgi:hypothetical protein